VLVDGIPRVANNVLPSEIDQITFLKGAQAVVLYGSRAAKGVIYITTKRGKTEDFRISVRANTGFHISKSYPEYLGSAEYMTLYNEARANDGLSALYSDNDIYHSASGLNPYRYPNVDFYSSEFLKKVSNRSEVTAEITGGSKRAHFYSNVGYYHQDDCLRSVKRRIIVSIV
jgi:TonB-dependent Receptor Plug Domain.